MCVPNEVPDALERFAEAAAAAATNQIPPEDSSTGDESPAADEKPVVKQRQKKAFKDPSRWRCPHPGCNRSFAVLWRLKVHYRAPVDARGSGVERGHGMELSHCPKCNVEFQHGRHHVNCRSGRTAGPPNAKRKPIKRSAESSASEETMVTKKQAIAPSTTSSPSLEAASASHQVNATMALAFAQFLQTLVPPTPTLEQQLLTSLFTASAALQQPPAPVLPSAASLDVVRALVALKQPGVEAAPSLLPPPAPLALAPSADDTAVQTQLLALLAAQGMSQGSG